MNKSPRTKFETVNEYMASLPKELRKALEELRATIKKAAPRATEVISYGIPAFKGNRVLVYYAAYKGHIGFYPTSKPIQVFKDELVEFKTSRGAIQFPLGKSIPKTLVKNIVKFRLQEDLK